MCLNLILCFLKGHRSTFWSTSSLVRAFKQGTLVFKSMKSIGLLVQAHSKDSIKCLTLIPFTIIMSGFVLTPASSHLINPKFCSFLVLLPWILGLCVSALSTFTRTQCSVFLPLFRKIQYSD